MSTIQLLVKSRHWSLKSHVNQHVLHNQSTSKLGWQRIVVIAKNEAAEQFLAHQGMIMARQNHHLQGVPLHYDDPKKASLVFYRHNPLQTLTMDWVLPAGVDIDGEPKFSLRIKPISAAKAWFFMLQAVARRDKASGNRASQIYRLTRARQKRSGRSHSLRKLVQAYQPLLQHQLISCEPFNYWRLHSEPKTREALLAHYKTTDSQKTAALPENVSDIKSDQWYHTPADGVIYTKQFEQLLHAATVVADQKHADIIYWDHDHINEQDERVLPHFKPDWSPDLLAAQDYIGPAYAIKGRCLKNAYNRVTNTNDHYIRLVEAVKSLGRQPKVLHIPVILEHHTPQVAIDDPMATIETNRQQAVSHWLTQQGDTVESFASAVESGVRKINFGITPGPADKPLISIIVPTRNALDITQNCINSVLQKTEFNSFEIIIVDNQSDCPQTLKWFEDIQKEPKVRVIRYDAPFNYSAINNFAVTHAQGELLCFLNNDTEVINGSWLGEMAQQAQRSGMGCVGAKLYYPDNTVQHAGVVLGLWGLAGHGHKNFIRHSPGYCQRLASLQNYSAVTAACLMMKASVFNKVGGFNEKELKVAFNDVDLCLKALAAGYRTVWTPYAELYHFESKTRGKEDTPEKKARERGEVTYMQKQWAELIKHDPAYNPNLTKLQEDFGVNLEPNFTLKP
ncbi:glycosyltransferase family 2 protein [Idiomarina sp. Sol25]|uniref:glycosyltransferase family 2 protein n=1 Tax=Idiomarina sp. Sol25 TaxID=3064000 RepID=UPI00294ACE96|nr:glycosyltransferase family 2 protein [Idiomarina sp. Sol25]MDV6328093.1 glycosyltransferase family 2 protein [Idiomarina sp. Sol25]